MNEKNVAFLARALDHGLRLVAEVVEHAPNGVGRALRTMADGCRAYPTVFPFAKGFFTGGGMLGRLSLQPCQPPPAVDIDESPTRPGPDTGGFDRMLDEIEAAQLAEQMRLASRRPKTKKRARRARRAK